MSYEKCTAATKEKQMKDKNLNILFWIKQMKSKTRKNKNKKNKNKDGIEIHSNFYGYFEMAY